MSEYIVQRNSLVNVADEIRVLSGTTEELALEAMAENVAEVNAEVTSQADLITSLENALQGKSLPADPNLLPENIKSGVTIYGVEGTLKTGVIDELLINNAATSLSAYCYYRINSFVNIEFTKVRTVNERAFIGCNNMESVDFSGTSSTTGCNKIGVRAFSGCWRLKTVIIRNPTITGTFESDAFNNCCHFEGTAREIYKQGYDENGLWTETLIETINPDCAKDGYIYVPSALVADYQTLLPDYATQFRALEAYTVDGTTTGALDETKI